MILASSVLLVIYIKLLFILNFYVYKYLPACICVLHDVWDGCLHRQAGKPGTSLVLYQGDTDNPCESAKDEDWTCHCWKPVIKPTDRDYTVSPWIHSLLQNMLLQYKSLHDNSFPFL